jgi:hypothetical protein
MPNIKCKSCGVSLDGVHHLTRYCDLCRAKITIETKKRWAKKNYNRLKNTLSAREQRKRFRERYYKYNKRFKKKYYSKFPWLVHLTRARSRCRDKTRKHYFGKGVLCSLTTQDIMHLWKRDRAHRLKKPSLDRISSAGNYELSNCRFVERHLNHKPKKTAAICLILALFSLFAAGSAQATIPEHLAVRALVGEAGGQQDSELLAHAFALRNRGTLRGVYGLHAPHLKKEPAKSFERAQIAWQKALRRGPDPVAGRTEWRSDYDLKLMARRGQTPSSVGLKDGLKIGATTFYRLKGDA